MHNIPHTDEAKLKMRLAHLRKHAPHTNAWNKNIGLALTGLKRKIIRRVCLNCGKEYFKSNQSMFCSRKCNKGSLGITKIHSQEWALYKKECAICGSNEKLVGDHDHITGKARGILCMNCNLVIGNALEKTETLKNAIRYLEGCK